MSDKKIAQASEAEDLRQVVLLSEEIKKVIDTSARIRLSAINAMLSSRRAGSSSLSFGVVSSELRGESRRLDGVMHDLSAMISDLVRNVAQLLRKKQQRRRLLATLDAGGGHAEILRPSVLRQGQETGEAEADVRTGWARMLPQIRQARRLCEHGAVLSRNAKIEAVHGGGMEKELRQVAEQIEDSIMEMLAIMKALEKAVAK